jgi:hypothetical protein
MSIFQQDFGKSSVARGSATGASGGHQFAPLNFRNRNYCGVTDGDYRVIYTDGSTTTVRASSALEAMEQALQQGPVQKVERATLKRVRLLGSDLVQDRASEPKPQPLIKPGTILVSFDTMSKFIHQQQAEQAQSAEEVAAPAFAAPVQDEAASQDFSPQPVEPVVPEASEPEANVQPQEAAPSPLPASSERPLTPDEVDHLLNTPPEA